MEECDELHHHVLRSGAQRRHVDRDRTEPVEERAPEAAFRDAPLQRSIGGREEPQVDLSQLAADRLGLSGLQRPEQQRLGIDRHLPDLDEEQRPAVGLAEVPGVRPDGAGESAASVAEQLACGGGNGDGGAVHCDEGFPHARAGAMQGRRHSLLADPGFAPNQHRMM